MEITEEQLKHNYFPTPPVIVRAAIAKLPDDLLVETILDPCAGETGIWGIAAKERYSHAHLTGMEIRGVQKPSDDYDEWLSCTNFLEYWGGGNPRRFDLIVMNPPFKKDLPTKFTQHGMKLLRHGGVLISLQRAGTLAGIDRYRYLYSQVKPWKIAVLIQRASFTGDGQSDKGQEYVTIYWRKGLSDDTEPVFDWLDWRGDFANGVSTQQDMYGF